LEKKLRAKIETLSKWFVLIHHHHHHHQFILETQNRTMSENTEQNNKTCSKGQKGRNSTYNCPYNKK